MAASAAPVGGIDTVVLGSDDVKEVFNQLEQQRKAEIDTPDAAPRFPQAPGGNSSVNFASAESSNPDDVPQARGPVGGEATIVLGIDDVKALLLQHEAHRNAEIDTPDAAPRFMYAPGGAATICFSGQGVLTTIDEQSATRGPVGGVDSLVLGQDDAKLIFAQLEEERAKLIDTPDAAPRFLHAPGGSATICLSSQGLSNLEQIKIRGPVGGTDSVQLKDKIEGAIVLPIAKGPVGGAATVVLGGDDTAAILEEHQKQRLASVDTPAALARFTQAPGGVTSISLASDGRPDEVAVRGAVGGASTCVLGGDDTDELMIQYQMQRAAAVETPDAAPRFTQAPGGTASINFSAKGAPIVTAVRGEVGGSDTMVLGNDNTKEMLISREMQRRAAVETPDAAPRFTQAPGGATSITLSSNGPVDSVAIRGSVGGADTVILGQDNTKEILILHQMQRAAAVETPDAAPRFTQAPGGETTISFSSDGIAAVPAVRGEVGGAATIVLGGDDTKESFKQYELHHGAEIETPDAAPRFQQATGGTATIALSGGTPDVVVPFEQAPGGNATIDFGTGGIENPRLECGRTNALRTSKQILHAPGGTSTLCLGASESQEAVSSNRFANGASQNCGNVITDRSSTRLHQAPGGNSSLCLGNSTDSMFEGAQIKKSKSTKTSSKALDENVDYANLNHNDENTKAAGERAGSKMRTCSGQNPGGNATILLG